MMNTIEDVVRICEKRHELRVKKESRPSILGFLRRDLALNPWYDLDYHTNAKHHAFPIMNILVDKLLLFSYLTGRSEIIVGSRERPEGKLITSALDLYLLRPSTVGMTGKYRENMRYQTDRNRFSPCFSTFL